MTTTEFESPPPATLPPPSAPVAPIRRGGRRLPLGGAMVITASTAVVAVAVIVAAVTGWGASSPPAAGPATTTLSAATTLQPDPASTTPAAAAPVAGLTDVSDIAAAAVPSVVEVEVAARVRGRQQVVATGSGVILDEDGTIVTNAHVVTAGTGVVAQGTALAVVLSDGTTLDARLVEVSVTDDLAVLEVDAAGLSPIEIGDATGLEVGEPVIAVGNPLGLEGGPSVTTGIVSALDRTLQGSTATLTGIIQTDAAITEGSSGGALLDGQGRLVGITTAVGVGSVGIEGIGFAIPVESIAALVAGA